MQRLDVSGAVRPLYGSLSVKGLSNDQKQMTVVKPMIDLASQCETLSLKIIFLNFRTSCILNVNNTGTKYVRIMKQTAF